MKNVRTYWEEAYGSWAASTIAGLKTLSVRCYMLSVIQIVRTRVVIYERIVC